MPYAKNSRDAESDDFSPTPTPEFAGRPTPTTQNPPTPEFAGHPTPTPTTQNPPTPSDSATLENRAVFEIRVYILIMLFKIKPV